jgi:hypothetical protein
MLGVMGMRLVNLRLVIILAASSCYAASIYFPAISYVPLLPSNPYGANIAYMPGWFPLAFGWFAVIFFEFTAFTVLANPIFFASIISFGVGKNLISALLAAVSIILGVIFFPLSQRHPVTLIFSAHGEALNHPKPMAGFFFWIAAFVIMLLGSVVGLLAKKYSNKKT